MKGITSFCVLRILWIIGLDFHIAPVISRAHCYTSKNIFLRYCTSRNILSVMESKFMIQCDEIT